MAVGFRRNHEVVLGNAQAAAEYAPLISHRRVTHVMAGADTTGGRVALLRREGTLKSQLHRAAAGRAHRIVVAETSDAETWNTAQAAARLCPHVDVLAYIGDSWMQDRLSRASPEARLRTFSYAGGVARQVMLAHPPYLMARRYGASAQHIVVVGFGPVGQAIAREFLVTSVSTSPVGMMVTAIDAEIEPLRRDFEGRHPGLGELADLAFLAGDIRTDDPALMASLRKRVEVAEPCAVYVAVGESDLPLSVAIALRDRAERMGLFQAPIFICAHHGAGLPLMRQGSGLVGQSVEAASVAPGGMLEDLRLVSFGTWQDAFDGCGLFEPHLDQQARIFHEAYCKLMRETEPDRPPRPSEVPWDRLDDEYRVANRRTAAHARARIDAVGFDLETWLASKPGGWMTHDLPPAADEFDLDDPVEMDALAELEHRRWVLDRVLNGWRYGPARDNRLKTHPDIKPGRELDEAARQKDRNNIIQTATILRDIVKKAGKKK
jgi:voltage-gated potassium channel Kch